MSLITFKKERKKKACTQQLVDIASRVLHEAKESSTTLSFTATTIGCHGNGQSWNVAILFGCGTLFKIPMLTIFFTNGDGNIGKN